MNETAAVGVLSLGRQGYTDLLEVLDSVAQGIWAHLWPLLERDSRAFLPLVLSPSPSLLSDEPPGFRGFSLRNLRSDLSPLLGSCSTSLAHASRSE